MRKLYEGGNYMRKYSIKAFWLMAVYFISARQYNKTLNPTVIPINTEDNSKSKVPVLHKSSLQKLTIAIDSIMQPIFSSSMQYLSVLIL